MRVRVLGAYGTELLGRRMTGFLLNDTVVMDAGTIEATLDVPEQLKIQHILLSHTHLDHTKGVAFLADNVCGLTRKPITLVGTEPLVKGLARSLLNNEMWPDFTRIPDASNPVFRYRIIPEGRASKVGGLRVTPIRVNHPVPTTGFLIRGGDRALLYSGDTGPTERLWKLANRVKTLHALFIECSFPNRLQPLAELSGHLTPATMAQELQKVRHRDIPVYVYHLKPRYLDELKRELTDLGLARLQLVEDGQTLDI